VTPRGGWSLVFQSRSGRPEQPWLGPDIDDAIAGLPATASAVIVVPVGFVSDHMEVIYDLDRMAASTAESRGVRLVRSPTAATDPRFVAMICDLVAEADHGMAPVALGTLGPAVFPCATGCCPPPSRAGAGSAR
jgi:ferrochelatase